MPRKKPDHTVFSVEFPDLMLEALRNKANAAGESISAQVCRLVAAHVGQEYEPPARGPAAGTVYKSKPGKKPKAAKKPRKS